MSFWHKVTHAASSVVKPIAKGAAKVITPVAQAAGGALAKSIDKVVPGLGTGMGKALSEVSGDIFDHKSLSDLVGDSIHDRQNNDASPLAQIAHMFLNGKNGTGVPNISQGADLPQLAFSPRLAAHQQGQAPGNGQTQAAATVFARCR